MQTYTAVTKQVDGWWIGWIAEVAGVNAQESTREALLDSLAETLREALEWSGSLADDILADGYGMIEKQEW